MNKEKLHAILAKQFNEKYYTAQELQYGNEAGTYISPFEYKQLIEYKESIASLEDGLISLLPLPAFNSKCLYYCFGNDLKTLLNDFIFLANEVQELSNRFSRDFIESRIYSEIEGSLNVENVPTTRKRLKELLENNAPVKDKNDIIIKNMKAGIDFVHELREFNKENLFKLYTLLSKNTLDEEDKLRPGDYYRHDSVEISRYHGCPYEQIEPSMNALFTYVNETLNSKDKNNVFLLPHFCHYYILYIHPYFDYNGRTARMVSYWVYLLSGANLFPPIISEAINQTKSEYYRAIELTRDSHNDLTYFLKYLLSISLDYIICYQNLKHITQVTKNTGNILTSTELNYIKKILISYKGVFTHADFLKMINVSMTKQGALKTLNKFIDYGVLKEVKSSSKTKLFDINKKNIPFALKNFGYKGNYFF
ncbi:MAG: Fic/DOC family protein [Tenericutes bacterium ADurb.Bin087]|nr:MAG: Fic/DOC family protein [Tenericutes bacterium ADurb.Bin087]